MVLPESYTLNLIIGRETRLKEELPTSVEEAEVDSAEDAESLEPNTDTDTDRAEDHTCALTESKITKLLNLIATG